MYIVKSMTNSTTSCSPTSPFLPYSSLPIPPPTHPPGPQELHSLVCSPSSSEQRRLHDVRWWIPPPLEIVGHSTPHSHTLENNQPLRTTVFDRHVLLLNPCVPTVTGKDFGRTTTYCLNSSGRERENDIILL